MKKLFTIIPIMTFAIIGVVDQINNGIATIEISVNDMVVEMVNLPASDTMREGDIVLNWRY